MISTTIAYFADIPLETVPVALACLGPAGTIIDANSRFLRLFRVERPRFRTVTLEDLVSEPHRPAVRQALLELDAGFREGATRALTIERSTVPALWLTIEVSRCRPGVPTSYLVCAQPMFRTRREDVTSVDAWPAMLTALSHELRGSLNAIRGWVSMVQGGALPATRIPKAIGIISRNVDNLWRLVETLFDLSRNANGSLALKLESVDLNELVELVAESAYPAAVEHDVTLRTNRATTAVVVSGDRVRLEQVVRNLVDNAVKFTPRSGTVTLTAACHPPFGEIVVEDTGAGISSELLPAIFEPFKRGGVDVAPSDVGVGLGLALVREIVQLHGGEITAFSVGAGMGSTFAVKLPLATGSERATEPPPVHGRTPSDDPLPRQCVPSFCLRDEVC